MKLDKHWKVDLSLLCPFCGSLGLMYDTHEDKDSNYYCEGCQEGFLFVPRGQIRNKEAEQ